MRKLRNVKQRILNVLPTIDLADAHARDLPLGPPDAEVFNLAADRGLDLCRHRALECIMAGGKDNMLRAIWYLNRHVELQCQGDAK